MAILAFQKLAIFRLNLIGYHSEIMAPKSIFLICLINQRICCNFGYNNPNWTNETLLESKFKTKYD